MDMYRNDYNGGARLIDIANQNIARSQRGYINHNGGASSDHQLRKSFEFLEVSLGKMTIYTNTFTKLLFSSPSLCAYQVHSDLLLLKLHVINLVSS